MKKKGFTLIELLAVIVILAIIALIATPLVLKYIEKSRKESKVDSAYSYVRNLETEIANYSIKNNGSRFNKLPINGKFYELGDFEDDKAIDTTVKGDTPDTIKVCLSSLGQVEKAMFKYGKYYVSYDGKKGSVSDEATYTDFSCSGNIAGGGNNSNTDEVVFDETITFEPLNMGQDFNGTAAQINLDLTKFENPAYYTVTISDTNGVQRSEDLISVYGDYSTFMLISQKVDFYVAVDTTGELGGMSMIMSYDSSIVGERTVKITKSNKEYIPHVVRIPKWGAGPATILIMSSELEEGETIFRVKDNEGNLLNEETTTITKGDNTFVVDSTQAYSGDISNLLENDKTLIIEVIQNGKTYTLGGSEFTHLVDAPDYFSCTYDDYYYWGNDDIEQSPYGC